MRVKREARGKKCTKRALSPPACSPRPSSYSSYIRNTRSRVRLHYAFYSTAHIIYRCISVAFESDPRSRNARWHSVIFLFIVGFHSCPVSLLSRFSELLSRFPAKFREQRVHGTQLVTRRSAKTLREPFSAVC